MPSDKEVLRELNKTVVAAKRAEPWERVLKAAAEEGDVVVGLDGKVVGVKLSVFPEFYRLARQAFPVDPEQVARRFHEEYERLAPQYGYETRADTKAFDPTTPNGKLMIAVCDQMLFWFNSR